MNRYERVVVEMVKPSTTAKSAPRLPLEANAVIKIAAAMVIVATIPDMVLTAIGVPYLPLKRPKNLGAVRSSADIAYVRSAPMIQVPPLEATAITKPRPTSQPRTVAIGPGSTLPTL